MDNLKDPKTRESCGHLVAEMIVHSIEVMEYINNQLVCDPNILIEAARSAASKKNNSKKGVQTKSQPFESYYDFKSPVRYLKPHQILAINWGEKKKELKVKVVLPERFSSQLERHVINLYSEACQDTIKRSMIREAISEVYSRLVKPLVQRRLRSNLTKKAETASVDVFADNLRNLLLTPPCRNMTILGIDPGFKHGSKMAVIDVKGSVLDTAVIYPKFFPEAAAASKISPLSDSDLGILARLIDTHAVEVVAIGNGTASRQVERLISDLIATKKIGERRKLAYTIVNEDGASIYR